MNLADWNAKRKQYWEDVRRKVTHPEEYANGFDCPECGGHLYDNGRQVSVAPVILQVRCQQCKFKGERYE